MRIIQAIVRNFDVPRIDVSTCEDPTAKPILNPATRCVSAAVRFADGAAGDLRVFLTTAELTLFEALIQKIEARLCEP